MKYQREAITPAKSLFARLRQYARRVGLSVIVAVARPEQIGMDNVRCAFLWGGELLASGVFDAMVARQDLFELQRYLSEPTI